MELRRGEINAYVPDPGRSAEFYRQVFGFEPIESDGNWIKLRTGNVVLLLFGGAEGERNPKGPRMTADLAIPLDEFDATVERLRAAGAQVGEVEGWERGRFVLFADPDGIEWELIGG